MTKMILAAMLAATLSACVALPNPVVDAQPITNAQGSNPVRSPFGAVVTGRDWNNQPSEARGSDGY